MAISESARDSVPARSGARHGPGDARLIRLARAGEARAFETIFARYHQELYRYCRAILGNAHDAEDALQATMAAALGALPGETRRISLRPWLYRVAHNEAISIVRRRQPLADADAAPEGAVEGVEAQAESRGRLRELVADLRSLPDRQRSALVMRELSGLAYEQIGAALGTSSAGARQTVYEARLALSEAEAGREMDCEQARLEISDRDRRALRGRRLRAHLRSCESCRDFRAAIARRRSDLQALCPPLPALAASGMLSSLLGGSVSGTAAGGGAPAVGAGAGASAAAGVAGGGAGAGSAGLGGAIGGAAAAKTAVALVAVAVGAGAAGMTGIVKLPGRDEPLAPRSAPDRAPGSPRGAAATKAPAPPAVRGGSAASSPTGARGVGGARAAPARDHPQAGRRVGHRQAEAAGAGGVASNQSHANGRALGHARGAIHPPAVASSSAGGRTRNSNGLAHRSSSSHGRGAPVPDARPSPGLGTSRSHRDGAPRGHTKAPPGQAKPRPTGANPHPGQVKPRTKSHPRAAEDPSSPPGESSKRTEQAATPATKA